MSGVGESNLVLQQRVNKALVAVFYLLITLYFFIDVLCTFCVGLAVFLVRMGIVLISSVSNLFQFKDSGKPKNAREMEITEMQETFGSVIEKLSPSRAKRFVQDISSLALAEGNENEEDASIGDYSPRSSTPLVLDEDEREEFSNLFQPEDVGNPRDVKEMEITELRGTFGAVITEIIPNVAKRCAQDLNNLDLAEGDVKDLALAEGDVKDLALAEEDDSSFDDSSQHSSASSVLIQDGKDVSDLFQLKDAGKLKDRREVKITELQDTFGAVITEVSSNVVQRCIQDPSYLVLAKGDAKEEDVSLDDYSPRNSSTPLVLDEDGEEDISNILQQGDDAKPKDGREMEITELRGTFGADIKEISPNITNLGDAAGDVKEDEESLVYYFPLHSAHSVPVTDGRREDSSVYVEEPKLTHKADFIKSEIDHVMEQIQGLND